MARPDSPRIPDWDSVEELQAAIDASTEENGLINAFRGRLRELKGLVKRCTECHDLFAPEELVGGYCEHCNRRLQPPLMLFIHATKCAGHSLRHVLEKNCKTMQINQRYASGWTPTYWYESLELHDRLRFRRDLCDHDAVIGHFPYGLHLLSDRPCNYGIMLRHPLNRLISLYEYLRTRRDVGQKLVGATFRDFCLNDYARELKDNHLVRVLAGEQYFADVTLPIDEEVVRLAIANLRKFAFVGLVEHFGRSMSQLKEAVYWNDHFETTFHRENVNPDRRPVHKVVIPHDIIDQLIAGDMLVYREAATMFFQNAV